MVKSLGCIKCYRYISPRPVNSLAILSDKIVRKSAVDWEDLKPEVDSAPSPLFFCNHFEELHAALFEVEMIINNAPLRDLKPNTIETCLKPNHLLFHRQLLYSSNTTSTLIRNLPITSSTTDKINHISNHFLNRWRHEFMWDTRNIKLNIDSLKINANDIVLVFSEKVPRHFRRISIVMLVLPSRDPEIRGAIVRIAKTNTTLTLCNWKYISWH